MATIKKVLKKDKERKNGHIPVYIRVTINRKSSFYSTGVLIKEKYWNANTQEVRKTHKEADWLNSQIDKKLDEVKAKITELNLKSELLTTKKLKKEVRGLKYRDFIVFTEKQMERYTRLEQHGQSTKYETILKQLKAFTGKTGQTHLNIF